MKQLGKIFLILFLFLSPLYVYAGEEICFTEETAKAIIVDIEKGRNAQEQVSLYQQANEELEYQIKLLKEMNSLRKDEIDQYKELVQVQKDIYEEALKKSKPSFFKQVTTAIGYVGAGLLIGLVLF